MRNQLNVTGKLAAGVAAVVLTLAAGGAAIAMNLAGNDVETPAGKFSSAELLSTPVAGSPTGSDTTVAPAGATPQNPDGVTTAPEAPGHGHSDGDHTASRSDRSHHETDSHHEGADDDD